MKNVSKYCVLIISILSILLNFSCKKGDTGPAGANGNANVKSQIFTVSPSQFYHFGTNGLSGDGYRTDINCTLITNDIVNKGMVMVYFSNNLTTWTALPLTVPFSSWSESWNFSHKLNLVSIEVQDSDFNTLQPQSSIYFKVIAITANGRTANPHIDWKNYSEVKQAFDLQD